MYTRIESRDAACKKYVIFVLKNKNHNEIEDKHRLKTDETENYKTTTKTMPL